MKECRISSRNQRCPVCHLPAGQRAGPAQLPGGCSTQATLFSHHPPGSTEKDIEAKTHLGTYPDNWGRRWGTSVWPLPRPHADFPLLGFPWKPSRWVLVEHHISLHQWNRQILKDVSLYIESGQIMCILGSSGKLGMEYSNSQRGFRKGFCLIWTPHHTEETDISCSKKATGLILEWNLMTCLTVNGTWY